MSRKSDNTEEQAEVEAAEVEAAEVEAAEVEQTGQTEEAKPELTTKENIAKLLADRKAADTAALEAAQKRVQETAELENVEVDSDIEAAVDGIKTIDVEMAKVKAALTAEIEPLNKQIMEIKAKPEYDLEELAEGRKNLYNELVEALGETAAKIVTGGAKSVSTGTGTGRGRNSGARDQVISAICDDNLTFAEAAEKYDHKGDGERTGSQKIGNLVKRHIDLAVKAGNVIKNADGTYSRA